MERRETDRRIATEKSEEREDPTMTIPFESKRALCFSVVVAAVPQFARARPTITGAFHPRLVSSAPASN